MTLVHIKLQITLVNELFLQMALGHLKLQIPLINRLLLLVTLEYIKIQVPLAIGLSFRTHLLIMWLLKSGIYGI